MAPTTPQPAETGYQHSAPCPYCYLSDKFYALASHFITPPPKPPDALTPEEKRAFLDAQKAAHDAYWARRYLIRRWTLLLAGTSIVILTITFTVRLYNYMHARGAVVAKMYNYASVHSGKWTVRKDWMLQLAILLVVNSPCACFAGYLIATAYYWKDKRDRIAKKKAELAKRQLQEVAAQAANPDPKLVEMKYEDLQRVQVGHEVVGAADGGVPAPVEEIEVRGRDDGVGRNVASWWSGVTLVHKDGYDGREVRKQNWEKEMGEIELQDRDAQAHPGDLEGVIKKARPFTEWPDLK